MKANAVSKRRRPHVALIIETSKGFGRGLLKGISRYVRTQGDWSIYIDERAVNEGLPDWLGRWNGHGLIVRAPNEEVASAVDRLNVPVVHALRQVADLDRPAVYPDDEAIARMAVDHLLERQFRNFAFVGVEGAAWSDNRAAAMRAAVAEAGYACEVYSPLSRAMFAEGWEGGQDDLAEWLRALPRPVGVMAAHDLRALCVLDSCRRIGVAVPEEVAVIGVDDDEVLCELADPPLTSVAHQFDRLGFEAASLLDALMQGGAPPAAPTLIAPSRVVARRSTDIVAIDDPVIAAAMRFIREHACDGVNVNEVCEQMAVSRRALERGFARYFGSSPHEQIMRVRLERVKRLLEETDYTLDVVAARSGFARAAYLSAFFRQQMGATPGEFRKTSRSAPAAPQRAKRSLSG